MENQTLPEGGEEIKKPEGGAAQNLIQKAQEHKKWIVGILLLIVLAGILFYYKSVFIAASVDGALISRLRVIGELEKQSGRRALDSIITETLIAQEAKAKNIVISDDEINKEIAVIEGQITEQGGTLQDALIMQGMTEEVFRKQIRIQKQVEKLLEDKIAVTDDEVQKYITDNKVTLPKDKETETRDEIKGQLKNQKLNQEASAFIMGLKDKATIKYYVNY